MFSVLCCDSKLSYKFLYIFCFYFHVMNLHIYIFFNFSYENLHDWFFKKGNALLQILTNLL